VKAKQLPELSDLTFAFKCDAENGKLFWRDTFKEAGSIKKDGYRFVKLKGRLYATHRIIWKIVKGADPISEIDHINRIKSDNRFCNLREASRTQNAQNSKVPCDNKSGHKGVIFHRKKWQASITVARKQVYLGLYETKDAAVCAYQAAAKKYFGEFARITN
jgi:hypothetical protein